MKNTAPIRFSPQACCSIKWTIAAEICRRAEGTAIMATAGGHQIVAARYRIDLGLFTFLRLVFATHELRCQKSRNVSKRFFFMALSVGLLGNVLLENFLEIQIYSALSRKLACSWSSTGAAVL